MILLGAVLVCGISGAVVVSRLSAHAAQNELFTLALRTFSRAPSVRIRGSTVLDGSAVNLNVVAGSQMGGGTVTVGPAVCRVALAGPTLYVSLPELTWQELGEGGDASALADRWLITSDETKPFSTFGQFISTTEFASILESTPPLVTEPLTRLDGASVIPLRSTDGSAVTFYVTTSRTPFLVAERGPAGWINFDEYGTAQVALMPTDPVAYGSLTSAAG